MFSSLIFLPYHFLSSFLSSNVFFSVFPSFFFSLDLPKLILPLPHLLLLLILPPRPFLSLPLLPFLLSQTIHGGTNHTHTHTQQYPIPSPSSLLRPWNQPHTRLDSIPLCKKSVACNQPTVPLCLSLLSNPVIFSTTTAPKII